jgi:di/tricarboxylate transporter
VTVSIAIVSLAIVAAAVLFALEVWTMDVVTLALLLVLVFSGILTAPEAFAGFSSDILIVLASLFVVSGALQETGAVQVAMQRVLRRTPRTEGGLVTLLMSAVAALSSVMNNTTVTGLLVGPGAELARRAGTTPSKLLMPLAFASMIGGTCTLIGTSTNVAVSGAMPGHGLAPLGFFEITPLGLVLVVVGVVWMALIGRHFLPRREAPNHGGAGTTGPFVSEMLILPDSPLAGRRLVECGFQGLGLRIVRVVRAGDSLSARPGRRVLAGDVLLFTGDTQALIEVKAKQGIELHSEVKHGTAGKQEDLQIVEAVVLADSRLVGGTVRDVQMFDASGVLVLGLQRRGKPVVRPLVDIVVHVGDVLLLQAEPEALAAARAEYALAFTDSMVNTARLLRSRAWIAAATFLLAIVATSLDLAPVSVCFLAAAVITVMTRGVQADRALGHVPWRLLIMIGGMSAFGTAIAKTGADRWYAGLIESALAPWGPIPVLGGFMLLTMLLSQAMSNAAAALVVLPVAIATAAKLDLDARPFAIGIMTASSLALATPFEPSSVIVFGPGRYRFRDFYVVGLPLSLLLLAVALVAIPWLWPLQR